ncbi:hypothetical protein HBB16_08280 [Pseudonocardia sp. MCCB 268]|nr:hypothetical protein [Pseudonocardia cytotoxica]
MVPDAFQLRAETAPHAVRTSSLPVAGSNPRARSGLGSSRSFARHEARSSASIVALLGEPTAAREQGLQVRRDGGRRGWRWPDPLSHPVFGSRPASRGRRLAPSRSAVRSSACHPLLVEEIEQCHDGVGAHGATHWVPAEAPSSSSES